jgi:hypothetical protein
MLLIGSPVSSYAWGLTQKICQVSSCEEDDQLLLTPELLGALEPDFRYVVERELLRGSKELDTRLHLLDLVGWSYSFPKGAFNTYFQHQRDGAGLHRMGWDWAIQIIEDASLCTVHPDAPWLDMYVDRTFHWCQETMELSGTVPYRRPWVGFIHHTCFAENIQNNTEALLEKPSFLASLPHCRALCVLSRSLQRDLQSRLQRLGSLVPVYMCYHPMPTMAKHFSPATFRADPRIVQVGAWYRDLGAIYRLRARLDYCIQCQALCGPLMMGLYQELLGELQIEEEVCSCPVSRPVCRPISRSTGLLNELLDLENLSPEQAAQVVAEVELLPTLTNEQYDQLLQSHVLFLCLRDASAVNTILEAIRYHTPVLVNRLPAVVEYLGEEYPLYYKDLDEAAVKAADFDLISDAHVYLKNLDASFLDPNRFLDFIQWLGYETSSIMG